LDELRLTLVTDRSQTRGRDLVAAELAALCRRLLAPAQSAGATLIVNDRVDVALAVGAGAVQRTGSSLAVDDIRRIAGTRLRIGASTHSLEDALDAEAKGADWVTFGPVYDTASKRAFGPPQGLARLKTVAGRLRVPVIAIGGITPERVGEVLDAGARGVAVISGILAADSPGGATRRFLKALDR
jgi:thiamine-phosphate pyrophosphorylase